MEEHEKSDLELLEEIANGTGCPNPVHGDKSSAVIGCNVCPAFQERKEVFLCADAAKHKLNLMWIGWWKNMKEDT